MAWQLGLRFGGFHDAFEFLSENVLCSAQESGVVAYVNRQAFVF